MVVTVPRVDRELRRISPVRALAAPLGDLAYITGAVTAAIVADRWYVDLLAVAVIARSQHALAIVMHEGAHRTLLAGRRANDLLARWIGYAVGVSMDTYRRVHTRHHQAELSDADPDLPLLAGYPAAGRLLRKAFRDVTLLTSGKNLAYMLHGTSRNASANSRSPRARRVAADPAERRPGDARLPLLLGITLAQLAVFGAFWASGHPQLYAELWLLPYLTLLPALLRVRAVAEHGGKQASLDRRLSTRTTLAPNSALRWLLAPHHVGLHVEHHVAPWVPHYRLPGVHRQLRSAGWLRDGDLQRGYGSLLRSLSRPAAQTAA